MELPGTPCRNMHNYMALHEITCVRYTYQSMIYLCGTPCDYNIKLYGTSLHVNIHKNGHVQSLHNLLYPTNKIFQTS